MVIYINTFNFYIFIRETSSSSIPHLETRLHTDLLFIFLFFVAMNCLAENLEKYRRGMCVRYAIKENVSRAHKHTRRRHIYKYYEYEYVLADVTSVRSTFLV